MPGLLLEVPYGGRTFNNETKTPHMSPPLLQFYEDERRGRQHCIAEGTLALRLS